MDTLHKKTGLLIGVIIAITLAIGACKKDYRDKWIGNWDFEVMRISGHWLDPETIKYDTIHYSGKISIGNANNELRIDYIEDFPFFIEVNENGELFQGGGTTSAYGNFEGKDKVYIERRTGGHGGGIKDNIDGTKK